MRVTRCSGLHEPFASAEYVEAVPSYCNVENPMQQEVEGMWPEASEWVTSQVDSQAGSRRRRPFVIRPG
jgi:hypothetical protein